MLVALSAKAAVFAASPRVKAKAGVPPVVPTVIAVVNAALMWMTSPAR